MVLFRDATILPISKSLEQTRANIPDCSRSRQFLLFGDVTAQPGASISTKRLVRLPLRIPKSVRCLYASVANDSRCLESLLLA